MVNYIHKKQLVLTMTDLDHILDIDLINKSKDMPPSVIFLEGLVRELELNGLDDEYVDTMDVVLRIE